MSKVLETTKELEAALDAAMPDRRWLTLLELFLPTGVAAWRGEIATILFLSISSSAISRALQCVIGRPDFSGFSHARAAI